MCCHYASISCCHYQVLQLSGAATIRCCNYQVLQLLGAATNRCCHYQVVQLSGAATIRCCNYQVLQLSGAATIRCCNYQALQLSGAATARCCKYQVLSLCHYQVLQLSAAAIGRCCTPIGIYGLTITSRETVQKETGEWEGRYCTAQSLDSNSGEVSLYHWPPVWLLWNQLYDNWHFLFLIVKQTNPNQSNRRSMVQWYFPL